VDQENRKMEERERERERGIYLKKMNVEDVFVRECE
jgi:hypothetical protein